MLTTLAFLLLAAVLAVPFSRKAGFGSILGYLVAGVLIGPINYVQVQMGVGILVKAFAAAVVGGKSPCDGD